MAEGSVDLSGLVCGVTGAGGYVGSALAGRLRTAGARVIEFRRTEADGAEVRPLRLEAPPPPDAFAGIGTLVHCAYDFQARGWEEIRAVNIEGTRRLFAAAAQAGVGRFILISSISAFPGCRSLYGRAKLEIEAIAAGCGAVIIRPGLVFGPRPGGMLRALGRMAGLPLIPLVGAGDALQYVAHEDDLGQLVLRAAARPSDLGGGPVIAAHPRGYALREIMTSLAVARGQNPRFVPIPTGLIGTVLFLLESAGLRPKLRRDSLVSLLHPDPAPDFSPLARLGLNFRPWAAPAASAV